MLSALRSPLSALRSPLSALRSPLSAPLSARSMEPRRRAPRVALLGSLSLLLLAVPSTGWAQASVNEGDRAALKALYTATNGANWTTNTNWASIDTATDLGTLHGVTVDSAGRVTELDLSFNRLTGVHSQPQRPHQPDHPQPQLQRPERGHSQPQQPHQPDPAQPQLQQPPDRGHSQPQRPHQPDLPRSLRQPTQRGHSQPQRPHQPDRPPAQQQPTQRDHS